MAVSPSKFFKITLHIRHRMLRGFCVSYFYLYFITCLYWKILTLIRYKSGEIDQFSISRESENGIMLIQRCSKRDYAL